MTLRTVVVDDEPRARAGLSALLSRDDRISVIAECPSAESAIELLSREKPDLVFLDIQMPGSDGFAVVDAVDFNPPPFFVFVTAHEAYSLKAFDVCALDYLLKPFSDERLTEAVNRAVARTRTRSAADLHGVVDRLRSELSSGGYLTRFAVRRRGSTEFLPVDSVDWLEADHDYVKVHIGSTFELVRGPLGALEQRLNPADFIRTHRSCVVRLGAVRAIRLRARGRAVAELHSGAQVPVSAQRRRILELALEGGSGAVT